VEKLRELEPGDILVCPMHIAKLGASICQDQGRS